MGPIEPEASTEEEPIEAHRIKFELQVFFKPHIVINAIRSISTI